MRQNKSISEQDREKLIAICGQENVNWNGEFLSDYNRDHTENLEGNGEVVVFPADADQVCNILKYCNQEGIPIVGRGAGTGLSGGAIPARGGCIVSFKRMNKVVWFDKENHQICVEPGVINQDLRNVVEAKGLFYPPDPASLGSCMIGGNIAENAGGPLAVKYGCTKEYVLNLQLALAKGVLIWTGANTLKNSSGYNLTQLITGSEGTLGLITKAVLKLIPKPKRRVMMLVSCDTLIGASKAVNQIILRGLDPCVLELMEKDAINLAREYVGIPIPVNEYEAQLLIGFDGDDILELRKRAEDCSELLNKLFTGEVLYAEDSAEIEHLWKLRRCIGLAIKKNHVYKEEDTVVPRSNLPELILKVKSLETQYGFKSYCYGHAGDGNLHINIVQGTMTNQAWNTELSKAIKELFNLVVSLGGAISGEHGIGLVQKDYLPIMFGSAELNLMKSIKRIFDPKNILNPGKIFLDE